MNLEYQLIFVTSAFAFLSNMKHARSECPRLNGCHCFYKGDYIGLECQGPNVSRSEICSICDRLNDTLKYLEVRDTVLTEIPDKCFIKCSTLQTLSLRNTSLRRLENSSFENLISLVLLNLDYNMLIQNCNFVSPSVFTSLHNLQYLSLQHNIDDYNCNNCNHFLGNIPSDACNALSEIHLDGVYLVEFGPNFRNYKNLTKIVMSGQNSKCSIISLSNKTFENLRALTYIDLSNCNITDIDAGTFEKLPELKHLNLSWNQGLGFAPLRNVSYGLRSTNIKVLDYSKVFKTFGISTILRTCDVWYLKETTLEEFYIVGNRLAIVETNALYKFPPMLRKVYAGDNEFSFGPFVLQISCLVNLQTLEVNDQGFSHDLRVYNKEIYIQDKAYMHTGKECSHTVPKWNKTTNPNCRYFTDKEDVDYSPEAFPSSLLNISIRDSGIKYNMNSKAMPVRNKLTSADLSGNVIYSLDTFFLRAPHLKYLNFSNNFCSHISTSFFELCSNLETLILSRNLLASVLAEDKTGLIFKPLTMLKHLDLSANNIAALPEYLFQYNENLTTLILSHNHLIEFNLKIDHLKKLAELHLQNNQLKTLSVSLLNEMKTLSLQENRSVSIDLTNNTLEVSCGNLQFLSWLEENSNLFTNVEQYKFQTVVLKFSELSRVLSTLKMQCMTYTVLIAVSSVVILVFMITVASGVLHRYRWRLQYLYYMVRSRYHKYEHFSDENAEQEYIYDAFISCANTELRFVRYHMLPKLEDEFGLKLCVHARDFLPGNYIAENILDAIQKSRKTVVILSKNFLKSKWCQYEFHMARMEGMYSRGGKSVLFVLIYEEVDTKRLSLEMLECIQGETYAKYPLDETERPYFWDTVKHALK